MAVLPGLLVAALTLLYPALCCDPPQVRTGQGPKTFLYSDRYSSPINVTCDTVTNSRDQSVEWLINDQPVDYGVMTNVRRLQDGRQAWLTIRPRPEDDQSTVRCRVSTSCGSSLSDNSILKRAFLEPMRTMPVRTVRVRVGGSAVFRCVPPAGYPRAVMSWVMVPDEEDPFELEEDQLFRAVPLDNRITMDDEGNLYITEVRRQDKLERKHYACIASNQFLRADSVGFDTKLELKRGQLYRRPLRLLYRSHEDVLALEGNTVRMKCIFSGLETTILWSRNNGSQLDTTRITDNRFELTISDVRPEDAGVYTCTGSRSHRRYKQLSAAFNLRVEAKPTWVSPAQDHTINEGETETFSCAANGVPEPKVGWFINGIPFAQAPINPRRVLAGDTLTLRGTLAEDTAVFQCNASNVHGYVYQDFFVKVKGCRPPSVSNLQQRREALFLDRSLLPPLRCRAQGTGDLQYTWLMDGVPLTSHALTYTRVEEVNGGQDLHFDARDTGKKRIQFQCRVSNACGTSLSAIYVYKRAYLEPFPVSHTRTITAPEGSRSVTFYCVPPPSVPPATITWYYGPEDWMEIGQIHEAPGMVDEAGRLHITNVRKEDGERGVYFCAARNSYVRASNINSGFRLRVLPGSEPGPYSPFLLARSPFDMRAVVGESVTMQCLYDGNPPATITWRRGQNDGDLDLNRTVIRQFEMTIYDVRRSDAGQYYCDARNSVQMMPDSSQFFLTVEKEPAWVAQPRDQIVHAGDSVTFLCEGEGNPAPRVQWYINGQPIEEVTESSQRVLSPNNLTFPAVRAEDSQVIQCNVSNTRGYLWADVFLQVLARRN